MKHRFSVRVGPATFRIGSAWAAPIAALADLYRDYPAGDVPDFTVRLAPVRPWRRWIRPSVAIAGDFTLPEAAPLPLRHALLAAEMAMNLQMALGWRRHLLVHAAVVEREGRAILISGESGAGKSTLASMLASRGWRFLGDEFALLDPVTGLLAPFPRPASLKNDSIALAGAGAGGGRWGPLLERTPKGDVRHQSPARDAIAAMDVAASPALILFPRHGARAAARSVAASEAFARLTQASTNYGALGEAGFGALTRLVRHVPAVAIDYPDTATALAQIEAHWS